MNTPSYVAGYNDFLGENTEFSPKGHNRSEYVKGWNAAGYDQEMGIDSPFRGLAAYSYTPEPAECRYWEDDPT